jgi:isoleucyl-tRNA synthetase
MVAKQASPEVPPLLVKDENDNLVPLVDLTGKVCKAAWGTWREVCKK